MEMTSREVLRAGNALRCETCRRLEAAKQRSSELFICGGQWREERSVFVSALFRIGICI
jgi:hypothetical protein